MTVNEEECKAAGVDPDKVKALVRMLDRAGKLADSLGITIFGGSGTGDLRKDNLIVAEISHGCWDGGDGSHEIPREDGLKRGESA